MIPNGSRFEPSAGTAPSPADGPREPVFLCIGRLDHQKGTLDVLPARLARNAFHGRELHFLGDGPLRPILESVVAGGAAPVRMHGNVDDVAERSSRAEAMILPSHFEGMSLSLLEAMSRGCVPIVSAASSAAEVITDGRDGFLFKVGDWRSMLDAIARYCASDARAIRRPALERSARFTRSSMFSKATARLRETAPLLEDALPHG